MMDNFSKCKFYRAFGSSIALGEHFNKFRDGSRRPKDTPLDAHHIMDTWFNEKFNIKARSSTIFVGTQLDSVNKYAKEEGNIIKKISFPLDSMYIYSLRVPDLYEEIKSLIYCDGYADKRNIPSMLEGYGYEMTCDPDSIPSKFLGEIMVYCRKFLLEDL